MGALGIMGEMPANQNEWARKWTVLAVSFSRPMTWLSATRAIRPVGQEVCKTEVIDSAGRYLSSLKQD